MYRVVHDVHSVERVPWYLHCDCGLSSQCANLKNSTSAEIFILTFLKSLKSDLSFVERMTVRILSLLMTVKENQHSHEKGFLCRASCTPSHLIFPGVHCHPALTLPCLGLLVYSTPKLSFGCPRKHGDRA